MLKWKVWNIFCLAKDKTYVYAYTRSIFAHTRRHADYVFHCVVRARIAWLKSKRLALTKQWNAKVEVCWPCANVSVVTIWNSFICFHTFHETQICYAHRGLSKIRIWAVNTDRRVYQFMIIIVLPLQNWSATMYETVAIMKNCLRKYASRVRINLSSHFCLDKHTVHILHFNIH